MLIESTRFGSFEVEASRSLSFDVPLLGFPVSSTYVVVEVVDTPYVWLQSVDEPEVADGFSTGVIAPVGAVGPPRTQPPALKGGWVADVRSTNRNRNG